MYQAIHQILPLLAGGSFVAWLFGPTTGAAMSTALRRYFCTITPKLLERMDGGTTRSRREQVGKLPTVDEFARAIADAVTSAQPARSTIFVGNTD